MSLAVGEDEATALVCRLVARARAVQAVFAHADQDLADRAVAAAAWAIMEPARNRALAEQAVADTGLGAVADKIAKNHRKTLGLLRDLHGARSVGVIAEDPARGLTEIARPVGVVAAVTPSTNPAATPANNVINALKGGNAIILAPSPKGAATCRTLVGFIHAELAKVGLPADLVQMLPIPAARPLTTALMAQADLVVATGSRSNVRGAYASGTPALGVGVGNVAVIVTAQADPIAAAWLIAQSKTFDNATSCSSENALVVIGAAWQPLLDALERAGGVLTTAEEQARLQAALFDGAAPRAAFVGRPAAEIAARAGLTRAAFRSARILLVSGDAAGRVGPDHPFSGEKLSPVLTLYPVADFDAALAQVSALYDYQGRGHSVGIHGGSEDEIRRLGHELPVARVIVDQAHCVAAGGAFDNGLPFTLSLGCGTWGGNGFSDNLNFRHFLNVTRIARPIPPREPALEVLLGAYWARHGR
jgi:sulfoacetaldehyde dehydrogenase